MIMIPLSRNLKKLILKVDFDVVNFTRYAIPRKLYKKQFRFSRFTT